MVRGRQSSTKRWLISELTNHFVSLQLVIICCLQHKEIGSLFSVCRELRATVRWQPHAVTPKTACLPCRQTCSNKLESVQPAMHPVDLIPMWPLDIHRKHRLYPAPLRSVLLRSVPKMRTAMLTHFNLQTPHHGDPGLRTPAPPRAKRVMLAQPSCRAAVGSASTADSA